MKITNSSSALKSFGANIFNSNSNIQQAKYPGEGEVFNRSNCAYPRVRAYGFLNSGGSTICSSNLYFRGINGEVIKLTSNDLNIIWSSEADWSSNDICNVDPTSNACNIDSNMSVFAF
jgi:hypothetical protein